MTTIHLKGINGLRALVALVILWGHIPQDAFAKWSEVKSLPLPICCAYVFFVISGFLSGFRHSSIESFACYYKSKVKRIFPLYYSYLLIAVFVYCLFGWPDEVIDNRLFYYLFLVPNIPFCSASGLVPVVHLWFIGSLLLFYLIFPIIVNLGKGRMLKLSAIICIFWALSKWAIYLFVGKDTFLYRYWGITGFDCAFAGVFFGVLFREKSVQVYSFLDSTFYKGIAILAWVLFLSSGLYGSFLPAPVRVEYIVLLSICLIFDQLSNKPVLNLENKTCNWLGKVSYEIYVTQILIIVLLSSLYVKFNLSFPDYLVYLCVTGVVIFVSWLFNRGLSFFSKK